MSIAFNGAASLIILSGATTFNALDIYTAAKAWDAANANLGYLCPMSAIGMTPLGSGAYTDAVVSLQFGWKLQPSGYASGTQITVIGTLVTSDGSSRTVAPVVGSAVTWLFQVSTAATVVETGGSSDLQTPLEDLAALPDNPTLAQALMYLYMDARNKKMATSSLVTLTGKNGNPLISQAVVDDGTTVTRSEAVLG